MLYTAKKLDINVWTYYSHGESNMRDLDVILEPSLDFNIYVGKWLGLLDGFVHRAIFRCLTSEKSP